MRAGIGKVTESAMPGQFCTVSLIFMKIALVSIADSHNHRIELFYHKYFIHKTLILSITSTCD